MKRYAVYERGYCHSYESSIDDDVIITETDSREEAFACEEGYRDDSLDAFTLDRETGEVWDKGAKQTYRLSEERYYVVTSYYYEDDAGASIEHRYASPFRAMVAATNLVKSLPYCGPGEWWNVDVYAWDEEAEAFERAFEEGELGDGDIFHAEHGGIPRASR